MFIAPAMAYIARGWNGARKSGGRSQRLSHFLNRKHSATLALEKSLFAKGGARPRDRELANGEGRDCALLWISRRENRCGSQRRAGRAAFRRGEESRDETRETLGLRSDDVAVLFAGSGWERKGLRFAIEAIEKSGKEMRLLVAGRGDESKIQIGPGPVSRCRPGHAGALCRGGYFSAPDHLRSVFQCLS